MGVEARVREYLHAVRRRWRLAATAKGLAISGVVAFVLTIIAVWWANAWRFSDTAVIFSRSVLWFVTILAVVLFVVRPLLQKLSDARLARFIEEQHPHLQDRLVTAVEVSDRTSSHPDEKLFADLVAADALERTATVPPDLLVHPRKIFRPFVWAVGSLLLILGLGLFGPGIFRYGTKVLWVGWAQAKASPLYQMQVAPGDIVVGRNTDQEITAHTLGFVPDTVRIHVLYASNPAWETATMLPQDRGGFRFLLMNLREPLEYYAEANGVRSQQYKISVIDVPHVQRLELRYHFPAYTGMKDAVESPGGDIVALRGTEVTVVAHTDIDAGGGRVVLDDGSSIPLRKSGDRELQARLPVSKDAQYHLALEDHMGREAKASDDYLIQALNDAPPSLKVVRPGHDMQPAPIDEVVIGLEAQDDVRMGELQMHYSVNGGEEKAVVMARGGLGKEVSGTHTLPLEDFKLVPGDLVSFYGVAKDAASNAQRTEMYFLQVRPYERNYMQAQSGGGGGGAGQENTFLSERQKQIISGTWNVLRKKDQKPEQIAAQAKLLSSVQRTLKQQAQTMAARTEGRELGDVNEEFKGLVENLKKAAEAMEPAANALDKQKFQQALPPEQTALQHLLRAEAMYRDIQVAFGNGGGGGAGGASRDLSELFALELDTGKNQYETLQQMADKDNNAAMEDAMKKLEELARRQEDLSRQERQNQKESLRASSRWEQEMLRREAEELAKQMEQLARDMNSSQMAQAANRLQQAARDMQQAQRAQRQGQQGQAGQQSGQGGQQSGQGGQSGQQSGQQQGSEQSSDGRSERARAAERLREAGEMIAGQRNRSNEEAMRRLADSANQLARDQQQIAEDVRKTAEGRQQSGAESQQGNQGREGSGSQGRQQDMAAQRETLMRTLQKKRDMLNALGDLQRQLGESAGRMAANEKKTSQKLRGAASFIQEQRMEDKVRQGAFLEQRGMWPMASVGEQELGAGMQQLAERLKDAQNSLEGKNGDEKLQEALNLAERVREGLESLQRGPAREQGTGNREQNQAGNQRSGQQQGQNGQQGQSGQQSGQQGQQSGQQGQGQQGQQSAQGQQQGQQGSQGGQRGQGSQSGMGGQGQGAPSATGEQPGGFPSGSAGGTFQPGVRTSGSSGGPLTPEQAREAERQLQELTRQAAGLRPLVSDDPSMSRLASELVAAMERMGSRNLGEISASLIERWKEMELRLNRRLQGEKSDPVRLAGQERVPEKYRGILEEYYRSLSKSLK